MRRSQAPSIAGSKPPVEVGSSKRIKSIGSDKINEHVVGETAKPNRDTSVTSCLRPVLPVEVKKREELMKVKAVSSLVDSKPQSTTLEEEYHQSTKQCGTTQAPRAQSGQRTEKEELIPVRPELPLVSSPPPPHTIKEKGKSLLSSQQTDERKAPPVQPSKEPLKDLDKAPNEKKNEQLLPDRKETQTIGANENSLRTQFTSNLLLCKPTSTQAELIQRYVTSTSSEEESRDSVSKIIIHPSLIAHDEHRNVESKDSVKLMVLSQMIAGIEDDILMLVVFSSSDALSCAERSLAISSQVQLILLRDIYQIGLKADVIVYFDFLPRSSSSLMWRCASASQVRIYTLVVSQSLDEADFISDLDETSNRTNLKSLTLRGQSALRTLVSSRRKKALSSPDEEFAVLWPTLIELGWHAEAGGGLVDYHYCKPNFTSKSAKGKIKGKKHQDFFTSKVKVLEALRKEANMTGRAAELVLGLHDLVYWTMVENNTNSVDRLVASLDENLIECAWYIKGEVIRNE